mmetsp:Transcript_116650/g.371087  ORF Transcript_116650/g.371087 Transcript_116650/m.371087 type:complete len:81 (+) Transcript_116650:375-617(+)
MYPRTCFSFTFLGVSSSTDLESFGRPLVFMGWCATSPRLDGESGNVSVEDILIAEDGERVIRSKIGVATCGFCATVGGAP